MNQSDELIKEIGAIRSLMERSSKFMSISGLSGVLVGCYALIGAFLGYITVYGFKSEFGYRDYFLTEQGVILKLIVIAGVVLLAAIFTGWWMAKQKARRMKQSIWNPTSKSLFAAMIVPLLTGGVFAVILLVRGYFGIIASTLLIFYGLSLCAASPYTFREIRFLGLLEISLGLLALCFPGYGVWFWAFGFGILHIVYGLIVHNRYER